MRDESSIRPTSGFGRWLAVFTLAGGLLATSPAAAQDDAERNKPRPLKQDELHHILKGLEHGLDALERLGRRDEMNHLKRIADGVRREIAQGRERDEGPPVAKRAEAGPGEDGADRERRVATRQIEALKMARSAFRTAEAGDAADLVHRAIRAREVGLEGRRDEEARQIRERAPKREMIVNLLVRAESLYREWEMNEAADRLSAMTEELWAVRTERRAASGRKVEDGERPARRAEGPTDRKDRLRHELEVMGIAKRGLAEAERMDMLEILERSMHAREMLLAGRTDPEAMEIRRRAPGLADDVEILRHSADLWLKSGDEQKAKTIDRLASHLWEGRERAADSGPGEEHLRAAAARRQREKESLADQIEIFRLAHRALEEKGWEELADSAKRSMEVREVNRQGLETEEARGVRERAPAVRAEIETLRRASALYRESGDPDKARITAGLSERLAAHAEQDREAGARAEERERRARDERVARESRAREERAARENRARQVAGEREERIRRLEAQVQELGGAVRQLRKELEEVRRGQF